MAKKNIFEQQQENEAQAAAQTQVLQEAQQLDQQAQIMRQEGNNKAHDTEFSNYQGDSPDNTLAVIGKEEVQKAYAELMKYKEEKADLEARIPENEDFWKMNHWLYMNTNGQADADKRIKPKSAYLVNLIINKHADAMDNFPEANILPRAKDDEETAKVLSKIIPVIMEQNDYEQTYSDAQWYKNKNGASCVGVFWNNDKDNGLGNIDIKKIDLLNIFWKGGISDIQESPNVFFVTMMDNDEIKSRWPEINVGTTNTLGLTAIESYKTGADTSNQTAVIDWYYKKRVPVIDNLGVMKMQTVLHYCQFCNEQVIYASENDPKHADTGWYQHGLYPFVFDVLFPVEKSITGFGYIDMEKDSQLFIDKSQQAFLESLGTNARPRHFMSTDAGVNEDEFLDISKPIVHVEGSLDERKIRPVENSNFNSAYVSIFLDKITEMKETSGNTAASQGQASSATSGSAISSLQEAAGKLSRDSNKSSYRAYKQTVNLVIELIRQFYDEPRCFRIAGEYGENEFMVFDNSGLLPQNQGQALGIDLGSRLPIMDIDVKPQKKNAYSRESQNQTALSLYNMGFFAPTNADAALACMSMMDFDQIEQVKDTIRKNGTLMQLVMQMQQQIAAYQQQLLQLGVIVDAQQGTNIAAGVANEAQATADKTAQAAASGTKTGGGSVKSSKGSLSTQAANATRGSTSPN